MISPMDGKAECKSFGAKDLKPSSREKGKYQSRKAWRALEDKWNGAEQDDTLDDLTRSLMKVAVSQLGEVGESGDKVSPAREDINQFLEGEQKEHRIDDCVRWYSLLRVVERVNNNKELEARLAICEMILEKRPYLAFECPYDSPVEEHYTNSCVFPKMHQLAKDKRTPFHDAAKCGNAKIIAVMISKGREFYDRRQPIRGATRSLLDVVRDPDPSSANDETALELATKADDGYLETLEELLKIDKIATSQSTPRVLDKSFNYALNEGWPQVVNKFVEHDQRSFVTSNFIIQSIEKIDEPIKQRAKRKYKLEPTLAKSHREEIAKTLVRPAEQPDIFNIKVAKSIIERDLMDIWKAKPQNALTIDLESCLLHLAVMY